MIERPCWVSLLLPLGGRQTPIKRSKAIRYRKPIKLDILGNGNDGNTSIVITCNYNIFAHNGFTKKGHFVIGGYYEYVKRRHAFWKRDMLEYRHQTLVDPQRPLRLQHRS